MALEERGQVKTCLNHPNRDATARCVSCHKPVCEECKINTTDGNFCSRKCASKAADFRAASGDAPKPKRSIVKPIACVIIIIVAIVALRKHGHKIPVVGKYIQKIPFIGRPSE